MEYEELSQNTLEGVHCPGCLLEASREPRGARFIEGPRLGQSLECTRGEPCRLAVQGEALQAGEHLVALLSCGAGDPRNPQHLDISDGGRNSVSELWVRVVGPKT